MGCALAVSNLVLGTVFLTLSPSLQDSEFSQPHHDQSTNTYQVNHVGHLEAPSRLRGGITEHDRTHAIANGKDAHYCHKKHNSGQTHVDWRGPLKRELVEHCNSGNKAFDNKNIEDRCQQHRHDGDGVEHGGFASSS